MQVLTEGIGQTVLQELAKATDVLLAVAFFSPSDNVFNALCAVPRLRLVISSEFTINDPYKLEKLPTASRTRSVPLGSDDGKLHAKVLIVRRNDKTLWALLGSANMTGSGLFQNQEACVTLNSEDDPEAINDLKVWFSNLFNRSPKPNLEEAKKIFDSRSQYRLELRPKASGEVRYWALKTTSGISGKEYWPQFLSENVVLIGWEKLSVDPSKVSDSELRSALRELVPDKSPSSAAIKIRTFVDLHDGDLILICKGYSAIQNKLVHIYGLARVIGPFRADPMNGKVWRFKHDAVIQPIDIDLPKDVIARALQKDSLRATIHQLTRDEFKRIGEVLKGEGVQVEV